jgi:DNA recombination protein RmuC
MSISTIGILLIITIILLLIVIILVIFQFNKISLENARLQQIVSDEKQDMQSNIVLHTKNNILEGFGSINRGLLDNNENLLLKFSDLGTKLGSTMFENSQLLSNNINSFKDEFKKNINEDFDKLNIKVESKLDMINSKVEERLTKGFEETTKTFNNVIERLSKIDEAQKKIDSLSTNIISLQDVLTDKKSRGIFGEVQLYQILTSIFGEKNDKIFNTQYKLSTGVLVDAIVFAPSPVGNIGIDSKFPLENYKRIYDQETSDIRIDSRQERILS